LNYIYIYIETELNQMKYTEENQRLESDEMKRRMKCVVQDANAIISHLMDDKPLDGLTSYGVQIHTHLDNITTACDLNDNESKTWKI
jgi:hypothetical protein